jgi:hypothetical protein
MSHTVRSWNPESAHVIDADGLVSTRRPIAAVVTPMRPIAAAGIGSRIRPATTATKRAK